MDRAHSAASPTAGAIGWSALLIGIGWAWLCWLDWGNDGLFAPDATRHFANGMFWKDFLGAFRLDAQDYALSYYARYPVIKPSAYPPVFYLVEAFLFGAFGATPLLAKAVVLGSTLLAALYTGAWLRRWVDPGLAWAGALLLFLPSTVVWSHAVMLHMPSVALALASLHHAHRWLDSDSARPDWKNFWRAVAFGTLAVGTYFQAAVIGFVIAAWILVERRWQLLSSRAALGVVAGVVLSGVVTVLAASRWAPAHLEWVIPQADVVLDPASWTFYLGRMPFLFSTPVLMLAGFGIVAGSATPRRRRETRMLLVVCLVTYAVFSCLEAKEARYILFLGPPIVCLAVIGALGLADAIAWGLGRSESERPVTAPIAVTVLGGLLVAQVALASQQPSRAVDGFRELVAYVEEISPEGAVFYEGRYHGNFVSYLQAGDPEYRRRVVLGSKLLYAYAVHPGWRLEEYASSPEEVIALLRKRGGARLLLIEYGGPSENVPTQDHLRLAVEGPEFERLRSFPITGGKLDRVDVFRMRGPIETPDTVDLPFPILGRGTRFTVSPIER